MIRWFFRGVAGRRLTTRYPRVSEPAPPGFRARALLDPTATNPREAWRVAQVCLPGALSPSTFKTGSCSTRAAASDAVSVPTRTAIAR